MAYICEKPRNSCKDCPHYRFDEDWNGMCCWAQWDEEHKTEDK